MDLNQLVTRGEQVIREGKREKDEREKERAGTLKRLLGGSLLPDVWDALGVFPHNAKFLPEADCVILVGKLFDGQIAFTTTQQGILVKFWRSRAEKNPLLTTKIAYGDREHNNTDTIAKMLATVKKMLDSEQESH